jgi:hypothetical protein
MKEYPIIRETQSKVLKLIKFKSKAFLSKETMLRQTLRVDFILDDLTDKMLIHLKAQAVHDPDRYEKKVLRYEEYPRYETWQAHLVDSLPTGSIRRRVVSRFFGFGDTEVLGKRIIHEVIMERRLVFPDNSVPLDEYPPELGEPGWIVGYRHNQYDPYDEDYR